MNKVLLIICDGLSDRPIYELGGKTPLEAAVKPNLDKLTKQGLTGVMHTIDIGVRPGSDVAHLALFGYDIKKYYTGRGVFEAAGYGMDLQKGDVALRANFATVDKNLTIIDRRAGRIEHTSELVKLLNDKEIGGVKIFVKKGVGHRTAVVLRGKNLDGRITDVDLHKKDIKVAKAKARIKNKNAEKTAKVVNKFVEYSHEVLSKHQINKKRVKKGLFPANILLVRGAGSLTDIPSFFEKYGFKACCIAGAGLYKGIAKLLGMDLIHVKGATGKPDTNIKAKIKAALTAFGEYDFVFVHIKGADNLAEDGNFLGKKKFIEKIDKALSPLLSKKDMLLVLTADHTTSSYLKIHTADPVPVLIAGKNLHTDHVLTFGERSVSSGKLGHIQGKHLMSLILDFLGRAPLFGA